MIRTLIVIALIATSWPALGVARSFRVDQVPHGPQFDCDVCHLPAGGLNDFGFDAFLFLDDPRGDLDWSELYHLDSDGDGYTNGEELGDPMGQWRIGDPAPAGAFSHPGDRSDGLCGNGVLDGAEDCEGDVGEVTCDALGLGPGPVTCGADCRYDTSQCDSCGDGVRQAGEECDGDDLGGTTCMYLRLGTGLPMCVGCRLDTSSCRPSEMCGDGQKSGTELCDGTNLGAETCVTLGYDGGILACRSHCTYDTSGCVGDVADVSVAEANDGASPDPVDDDDDEQPPDPDGRGATADPDEPRGCTTATPHASYILLFGWIAVSAIARRRRVTR